MEYSCPPVPRVKGVTRTALLRGAWALIMNRFHGSEDAVFGTIVSGRRESFVGIQGLMGPTVATIPVRVRVDGGDSVDKYLEAMEDQIRSTSSFAQLGLRRIAQVSSDARQACSFQTLLVVQPGEDTHVITSDIGDWKRLETDIGRSSYALTIQCFLNKDSIRMVAIFDSTVLDSWRAQKMLEQFSFVTQQLAEASASRIVPAAEDTCVHDLISQRQVPMTNNGKTDRRRLREMGRTAFSPHALRTEQANKVAPISLIEKMLVEVWAEVLNMRPDDISTDMSFLRLGGDSITAMQVISRCRTRGIHLKVGELLREQTIQRVAALSTSMPSSLPCSTDAEPQGVVWGLSPIQRMFFELHPDGLHHFNQGFLLKMREMVPNDAVRAALQAVVSRHSMLRARFRRSTGGDWGQVISRNSPDGLAFSEHAVQSMEDIDRLVQSRHGSLDISAGPIFAADLFTDAQGTQFLFLVAHHLVVDLVSWRVLWHDIEHLVKRGEVLAHRTTSFHTWCGLQRDEATSLSLDQVLPLAFNEPDLEFWGISAIENTHEGARHFGTHVDVETTRLLLGQSNQAFGTEITDVLVAALAHSFQQAFPGRQPPPVHLEGHGRETLGEVEVDVSETVGWFTTMHPLQIPIGPNQDIVDSVRIAKDIRRRVPGKGRPYFNYRYTAAKSSRRLGEHSIPELTLNFTGIYQQLEKQNGLFRLEDRSGGSGRSLSMAGDAKRFCLVEVVVGVAKGRMTISFGVHQDMSHQPQLEAWMAGFAHQLKAAARSLSSRPASLTPGDFPLLPLTCDELDRLVGKTLPEAGVPVHTVRDMYPCTPLQEGILFSISKGTATYANLFIWECVAEGQGPVSPLRLEAAWRSVFAHHAMLSTVFVERLDVGGFIQVVLRNQSPRLSLIQSGSRPPADALREQKRPSFAAGEPQHALTICQASNGGVACRLDITHALIDAASVQILMGDLSRAYDGRCLPAHAPFAKFIQHTTRAPKQDSVAFWTKLLANVRECYFPSGHAGAWPAPSRPGQGRITLPSSVTSQLHAFCQGQGITRSVLIQVAWALVLSQYTGSRDVCFGYLASSRDIPVKLIDNTVGPLINVLIGHIDLDDTTRRVVATTFARSIDQLAHQHSGLAEVHRKLGPLFNTAMTVRESRQHDKHQQGPASFHEVESEDPDEFDVTLVVGISGASTDISLVYQNALLSPDTARRVAGVMCDAIGYLLSINLEASSSDKVEQDDRPLYDAFFTYRTGFHEDAGVEFWEKEFQGSEASQFPSLPSPTHRPCLDNGISHHVCGLVWPKSGFTQQAMISDLVGLD
ncbi:condensation domain-containing protein [Hirsutella rhossiliensis]|uniref:Condensation domain-containing protein n=1 Tax=Hirsutella rhossiliensis TaxID=111463 RepID=A0A9P8MQG0_9HYPO|nr:condensation domain-containing protein [Hirsutella rhossiliensis]KAH0959552.1 condensation domain-containing protein [Hirsutella rhossiliensis]